MVGLGEWHAASTHKHTQTLFCICAHALGSQLLFPSRNDLIHSTARQSWSLLNFEWKCALELWLLKQNNPHKFEDSTKFCQFLNRFELKMSHDQSNHTAEVELEKLNKISCFAAEDLRSSTKSVLSKTKRIQGSKLNFSWSWTYSSTAAASLKSMGLSNILLGNNDAECLLLHFGVMLLAFYLSQQKNYSLPVEKSAGE